MVRIEFSAEYTGPRYLENIPASDTGGGYSQEELEQLAEAALADIGHNPEHWDISDVTVVQEEEDEDYLERESWEAEMEREERMDRLEDAWV